MSQLFAIKTRSTIEHEHQSTVPYIVFFPDISSFIGSVIASCRLPYIPRYLFMCHMFRTIGHDICYDLIFALYFIVSVIAAHPIFHGISVNNSI